VVLARLVSVLSPPLCVACGADAGRAAPLCQDCRAQMRARPAPRGNAADGSLGCWAAFPYEGPAGAMVRALKFGGRLALADLMAAQIAALVPPELLDGAVVPVPVHPAHRRRRGLDHCQALARALARRTGLPLATCLVKTGNPRPQVGRGRRARVGGPAGSIALKPGVAAPERVLLVDDVITTGATLTACADALRSGGAQTVSALVYARTTAR
jgi:ComF family protein